jgi:hypothetical protein
MTRLYALAFAGLLAGGAARAQDTDLDRIPAMPAAAPAPAGSASQTLYLEDAFDLATFRGDLMVPPPAAVPNSWEEHLFFDARKTWHLGQDLSLSLSGRANVRVQRDLPFPDRRNFRLDWREAYVSWLPTDGAYVDFGRINLKSGVALGANPTDFFKTRAVVDPLSADPAVLRNDRLGTVMVRLQRVWTGGAATFAYAPKIRASKPIYTDLTLPGLDPMLDRTNNAGRFLIKANIDVTADFSPEALVYYSQGHTRFGLNLTQPVGKAVVAYAEWSGGVRPDLIHDALVFGKATGAIPPGAPVALPDDPRGRFRNDVVAGFSYTTASQVVINIEYHGFDAGFSRDAWQGWLRAGRQGGAPQRAGLWYIRQYAADQSSPIARHSAFVRFDRTDAFVRNLELQGFLNADLHDGSGAVQIEADDYVSNRWTIGALVGEVYGGRRSDFGSTPSRTLLQVKIARYF